MLLVTALLFPTPLCSEFRGHRSYTPLHCEPQSNPFFVFFQSIEKPSAGTINQLWLPFFTLFVAFILNIVPALPIIFTLKLSMKFFRSYFEQNKYLFYVFWFLIAVGWFLVYYWWSYNHPLIAIE